EDLFDCSSYSAELRAKLDEMSTQIMKLTRTDDMPDFDEGGSETRKKKKSPPKIELVGVEVSDEGKYAKGDDVYGCTAKQSMEKASIEVKVTADGDKETLTGVAVKVDDYWRILYLED